MKKEYKANKIDWGEQCKVKIKRNASIKHEVVKTLIVRNLVEKYKNNMYWVKIETERELENRLKQKKVADVYFENVKTNDIICYEVQKNISEKWMKETQEFYENFDKMYFTTDWITIKEKDLSENIKELNEQIKELIA